jgi:hypothetical protein
MHVDPQAAGGGRRSHPVRTLLGVLAVVVVAVLVVMALRSGDPMPKSQGGYGSSADRAGGKQPGAEATRPSGEKPVKGVDPATRIPVGYGRSEAGAQSAGTNYSVALGSSDMFVDDKRKSIINLVAEPAFAKEWEPKSAEGYKLSKKNLKLNDDGTAPEGLALISRTIPIGAKTLKFDKAAGTATVSLWSNGLIGLAGEGSTNPVSETWFTVKMDLRWIGNDWKMTQFTQTEGPTPVQADSRVSGADEIEKAVREYGGYTYAR